MGEVPSAVADDLSGVPLGTRIRTAVDRGRPPVAVIIEPNSASMAQWSLPDHPIGFEAYVHTLATACADLVCLAKIQPAAFERFGPDGATSMARAVAYLHAAHIPVLIDFKRADHGPVLRLLVDTYVGSGSPFGADGLTLLPYLGMDEVFPVAQYCADAGGLLAVVVQTSNKGALAVQGALRDGTTVSRSVAQAVSEHNVAAGRDEVLVVVGGPPDRAAKVVRDHHGLVVVPGWGRAGVDRTGLLAVRDACPDQVLFSIGSHLTHRGPHAHVLRETLETEIARMA